MILRVAQSDVCSHWSTVSRALQPSLSDRGGYPFRQDWPRIPQAGLRPVAGLNRMDGKPS